MTSGATSNTSCGVAYVRPRISDSAVRPRTRLRLARGLAPSAIDGRQLAETEPLRVARRLDEVDRVLRDAAVDEHRVAAPLQCDQLVEVDHLRGHGRVDRHAVDDRQLLGRRRVAHHDLHHEAVTLRVGQLVHALALDRVLRGDDEERVGTGMRDAADRHLVLLHHLEQGRLHLRRRTVDLVGEEEVDEHRAELDVELLAAAAVDAGADDVRGQQVRRELDPGERAADDVGQRLGGQRLGQPGDGLEQAVPAGEQTDEQPLEQAALADDHLAQLEEDALDLLRSAGVVHRRDGGRRRCRRRATGRGWVAWRSSNSRHRGCVVGSGRRETVPTPA